AHLCTRSCRIDGLLSRIAAIPADGREESRERRARLPDCRAVNAGALVIASPHRRHDALERNLRERLPGRAIVRIRDRAGLTVEAIAPLLPAWIFFPHWSWRIPRAFHERFTCVVFHMTDVPYGRGGSPLQNLIVRGHKATMISALACAEEIDAGAVYLK